MEKVFWSSDEEDDEPEMVDLTIGVQHHEKKRQPSAPIMEEESSFVKLSHVDKAGLESIDRAHVARVIAEATQGSLYAQHEVERENAGVCVCDHFVVASASMPHTKPTPPSLSLSLYSGKEKVARIQARVAQIRMEDGRPQDFLSSHRQASVHRQLSKVVAQLEGSRDLSRTCFVVDMDMFYCACELLDTPSLKGKVMRVHLETKHCEFK